MLKNVSPAIFGTTIPDEHQAHIDRYTREFVRKVEEVAAAAVADIRPGRLSWGCGKVNFAVNRRTQGGPVDHDLPVLVVRDLDGKVRALYFSYACHCVTLSNNRISGDWAGFAQEYLQQQFPGTVVLASVGCGADSNPASGATGDKVPICQAQGKQIGDEIKQMLSSELKDITNEPSTRYSRIDLAFDTPRTRKEWEERAQSTNYAIAYHAKLNLERLDRGQELPKSMTYPIQTWLFGDQLAIVFLPGETVVDYALRIKNEYDRNRVWINGYANESRCYIPSERVLKEGGYEGGGAMVYYDRPQRFAPGLEAKIMDVVARQLPTAYLTAKGTEGVPSLSAADSIHRLHTKAGFKVELVAAEPLIQSPVAIDWGADGKLWVCEMFDYPAGTDGDYEPGGRVSFLEDTKHDGHYDKATIFLENLPFPTGVTAWGKGVLVCAAPDILYAEDTDGDGKADKIVKLFSGFATDNYQARVNGLSLGLDNWIYGANGLISKTVTNASTSVDIRNRDFRFRVSSGQFEAVSGLTQQGRVRDDWGRWFGCANSDPVYHFPYEERYVRRNPYISAPAPTVWPAAKYDVGRVYPRSQLLERFNDPGAANRMTSGCGLCLNRDTFLGEEFYGNAFTCEPVHNLVTRAVLSEVDGKMVRSRAPDEQTSEFLASTDNWFRPVQARLGPDGALYIVDMYRFVIEHPRWIPAARLAKLDARAGAKMGRIYRVFPESSQLRPVGNLTQMSNADLAKYIDSPNGTERDRAHMELLVRKAKSAAPTLEKIARNSKLPQVRLQALCVLDGIEALTPKLLKDALSDKDFHVRQQAVRLSESFLKKGSHDTETLGKALVADAKDPAHAVVYQLAFTLGEWSDPRASDTLALLATNYLSDAKMRFAILSSAGSSCGRILDTVLRVSNGAKGREDWIPPLVATAAASTNDGLLEKAFNAVLPGGKTSPGTSGLISLANLLEALEHRGTTFSAYVSSHPKLRGVSLAFTDVLSNAREAVSDDKAAEDYREAAVNLLSREDSTEGDLELLCKVFVRNSKGKLASATLTALRRQRSREVAVKLLKNWSQISPEGRQDVIALLITRNEWAGALLEAISTGTISRGEISLNHLNNLRQSGDPENRLLTQRTFPPQSVGNKAEVLGKYHSAVVIPGAPTKGAEVFSKNCAACHLLDGMGHDVGPDLAALRNKDADYFIKNILDPNAAIEPRFVSYDVTLKDGRSFSGIVKSETATSLTVVSAGGVIENLKRDALENIHASTLSLMPEGLEQGISVQEMADLVSFLRNAGPAKQPELSANELVRDPANMIRIVLDTNQPNSVRETLISANPQFAADFIAEITKDLLPGTEDEYVRIPWLWRVAFAAGKRKDNPELARVIAQSLPALEAPLHDWQAVVLGGGIVNGLSVRGEWPSDRLPQILAGDGALEERWKHALVLAAKMADDAKVREGTRYDALRMLGTLKWDDARAHLVKYLAQGTSPELQQGAISALSDIHSPEVAPTLVAGLQSFTKPNLELALDALLRDEQRIGALLDAVSAGKVAKDEIGPKRIEAMKQRSSPPLASRVQALVRAH
jgi:putative membrane-bound dehydrogenase-like protein